MISHLSLARRVRPCERLGRHMSRSEVRFLDFVVDGRPLLDTLTEHAAGYMDMVSVLWLAPAFDGDDDARGLLMGQGESPLPDGRTPLYVCPECGDLGCGAVTAAVEFSPGQVVWRDLGRQTDYCDQVDHDAFSGIGPFVFERAPYEDVLATVPGLRARERHTAPGQGERRRRRLWRR